MRHAESFKLKVHAFRKVIKGPCDSIQQYSFHDNISICLTFTFSFLLYALDEVFFSME